MEFSRHFVFLYALLSYILVCPSQASTAAFSNATAAPTATVRNGTLVGRYLGGTWDQDLFLGIPLVNLLRPVPSTLKGRLS